MERAEGGSGVIASRPVLGATAVLANTVLVPLIGTTVKMLAAEGLSAVEILALRGWTTFLLLTPLLMLRRNREAVRAADLRAHAVHAAFAVSTMACFYFAFRTLPLVTVTAIGFTTPIFTLLLACLLYGDRVRPLGWLALAIGFAGAMLVLRPGLDGIGLDALVVLIGSLLAGGMNIAVRRMPARSTNYAVLFYLSLAGAVVYGTVGGPSVSMPTQAQFLWLLGLGLTAIAVHGCIALAYRLASSLLVGALDYGRIVFAALLGYLLFSEVPDVLDWVGIAMIIASGLVVLRLSTRRPVAVASPT
jgi:drug/metabolite transporter (DMT)-like permease